MRGTSSSLYYNFTSITSILKLTDKFQSKLSPNADLTFGYFLVIAGLLSLIGNGSILAVFYFRRRRLSPAEIFLVNLGIVDIFLALASYPCAMISSFNHRWIFGSTGCTLYAFTCYFLGVASLCSLTAIAIIRFLKTCSPALGNRINCETSYKIIVWVYIYSLFWACLPLIGVSKFEVEPFGLSCTLDWSGSGILSQVYIIMVSIFCVFIPFFIIIFCYSKIILLVRKSDKLVGDKRIRKPNSTTVSDVQLTWMSCLITFGFIVGWLPYTVVSLWATLTDQIMLPMWATPIPVLMAKSSIAYNPMIYIFLTRRYREDFMNLLNCMPSCHSGTNNTTSTFGVEGHPLPLVTCLKNGKYRTTKSTTTTTTNTTSTTGTGTNFSIKLDEHQIEMLILKGSGHELAQINEGYDLETNSHEDHINVEL